MHYAYDIYAILIYIDIIYCYTDIDPYVKKFINPVINIITPKISEYIVTLLPVYMHGLIIKKLKV